MDYFISHIGIIFIVACIIAAVAVVWWYLMERNARNIRQRAEARKFENKE
jgi:Ca2+-dependent lipid-binding protein